MSAEFEAVTRYRCVNCGKDFKTTRHDCKFDPAKRNCLTCRHCRGQDAAIGHIEEGDYEPPSFKCAAGQDKGVTDLDVIQNVGWCMDCEKWEQLDAVQGGTMRDAYRESMMRIFDEHLKREEEELRKITGGILP